MGVTVGSPTAWVRLRLFSSRWKPAGSPGTASGCAQGSLHSVLEAEAKALLQQSIFFFPLPTHLPSLNKTSPASTRDRLITSTGSLNRLSLPPRARSQESLPAMDSDFPWNTLGWVGTGCGGIPSLPGHPGTPVGMWLLCHGAKRRCGCQQSSSVPPCARSSCGHRMAGAAWLC